MDEELKCMDGHTWGGCKPGVDASVHRIQHQDLIGRPCDCGRMIYNEHLCGCSVKQWEVWPQENINHEG